MSILSIVIPVYNADKYLCQCLDSVLKQSLKDIEVILVDDGSTDKSGMICDSYQSSDSRVKVIHQKNSGAMRSRINGLKICTSKYVTFVDADDFIEKESYIHALPSISENIDIICFNMCNYYQYTGTRQICKQTANTGLYFFDEIREKLYPNMLIANDGSFGILPSIYTKIIKRELLMKSYKSISKNDFWLAEDVLITYVTIKMANSVKILNIAYYNYRIIESAENRAYFAGSDFFHEWYKFYCLFTEQFIGVEDVLRQIEIYCMNLIDIRKRRYFREVKHTNYLFPFDKVEKNDKIILYGAGIVGNAYREQLSICQYCTIVLWVDANYKKIKREGINAPEDITKTMFDKIVIAVKNKALITEIQNDLHKMGIVDEKIVFADAQGVKNSEMA